MMSSRFPAGDSKTLMPQEHVVAVIVSRDRPRELQSTVAAVRSQIAPVRLSLLIIDSSSDRSVCDEFRDVDGITILYSERNLGGAGGFACGIINALGMGAQWVWLMDDDGRPNTETALQILLEAVHRRKLDALAPVVLDPENLSRFAFPYPINNRYVIERDQVDSETLIPSFAHLFNGLLISAQAIFVVGLPDLRLFLRGDEVDYLFRMRRSKLKFGTLASASFTHPSSKAELHPVFNGRLHVVYPLDQWKRRLQYRNRGYNFWHHRQFQLLAVDAIRYPYFFTVHRRFDFRGLLEWFGCTWDGIRGRVGGPQSTDTLELAKKVLPL